MTTFNPYQVDEILVEALLFGLIPAGGEAGSEELHGYEVTMSGRIVLPELRIEREGEGGEDACATR